ncbi:SDR family NAD(P)-dependent oxidoreductase [Ureibacillus chungkukjangi]|uniref:3-oxoacyl-[acyl-carrier protein] reductase n=1 Tax=Ureibacillus chungkukjangi TaxID=1202712 RepID=A0A318TRZ3_9BACL|nr:SDR family oxidoreductase [Ureibacillus chungkukjangi]PYF05798.1 3-oxoacyl-[acyl-carrier protein] reductase [Ureibacillus chungkukjangi]
MELKGKVALVTGGGRGIGRETCLLLASYGADVAVCARSESECDEVVQTIKDLYGTNAITVICDVGNLDDVKKCVAKVTSELGKIDILINNAGVMSLKPFVETPVEEWQWVQDINVNGPFYLCKEVIPDMIDRKDGIIINIASIWGTKGGPNRSAYITSKHAIIGFTKALGEEMKPYGIRVNAISPGPVDTKMMTDIAPDYDKSAWLKPIDIANVIVDLVLPKSVAVTATTIEAFGKGQPVSN